MSSQKTTTFELNSDGLESSLPNAVDNSSDMSFSEADPNSELHSQLTEPSSEEPVKALAHLSSTKSLASVDPLVKYIQEIRKFPILSKEEEFELAKRYFETRDPEAAKRLIASNLRFVVKIALEYVKYGARLIDLISEGNLGLVRALQEYNPYKGVRLISYAVWWIRGYIQEYLLKHFSVVKLGATSEQKKLFYRLQKERELVDKIIHNQGVEELSQETGLSTQTIRSLAERLAFRDVSLDQAVVESEDSSVSLMDLQPSASSSPEEEVARKQEQERLKKVIEVLTPTLSQKEKIILQERLLAEEPKTLQEIANLYGITREAVRQTEVKLLSKIRQAFFQMESD